MKRWKSAKGLRSRIADKHIDGDSKPGEQEMARCDLVTLDTLHLKIMTLPNARNRTRDEDSTIYQLRRDGSVQ